MSIRAKIILAFLLMAAFLIIQSVVTMQNNSSLRALVELAIDKNYNAVSGISDMVNDMQKLRRYEKEYFIYITDVVEKDKYTLEWKTTFNDAHAELDEMIRNSDGVYSSDDVLAFSDWKDALNFYGAEFNKILEKFKALHSIEKDTQTPSMQANTMIHAGKNRLGEALAAAVSMSRAKTKESLEVVAKVEESFQTAAVISISLATAAVLIAVILIFVVPGGINQTLGRLLQDAKRISEGDLSQAVERSPVPEFDSLARSLETIRRSRLADSQRRGANNSAPS